MDVPPQGSTDPNGTPSSGQPHSVYVFSVFLKTFLRKDLRSSSSRCSAFLGAHFDRCFAGSQVILSLRLGPGRPSSPCSACPGRPGRPCPGRLLVVSPAVHVLVVSAAVRVLVVSLLV